MDGANLAPLIPPNRFNLWLKLTNQCKTGTSSTPSGQCLHNTYWPQNLSAIHGIGFDYSSFKRIFVWSCLLFWTPQDVHWYPTGFPYIHHGQEEGQSNKHMYTQSQAWNQDPKVSVDPVKDAARHTARPGSQALELDDMRGLKTPRWRPVIQRFQGGVLQLRIKLNSTLPCTYLGHGISLILIDKSCYVANVCW